MFLTGGDVARAAEQRNIRKDCDQSESFHPIVSVNMTYAPATIAAIQLALTSMSMLANSAIKPFLGSARCSIDSLYSFLSGLPPPVTPTVDAVTPHPLFGLYGTSLLRKNRCSCGFPLSRVNDCDPPGLKLAKRPH